MRNGGKGLVLRDLDRLFRRGTSPAGDGALLESYLADGDESAFEALVDRHGPMVRGGCRRLLVCSHDADDAFQATFLVLARKGGRLRDPDRLGPWLHGVATRVAGKARARAGRRRDRPIGEHDVPAREGRGAEWSDVMPIIDAELARLPAKHRDVLVACLLDGDTAEEASRRLACPVGTVKSRLARAREALRDRLTARGVAPALAVAAVSAESSAFASPVSSALFRATLTTALSKAVEPGVAALTRGVATVMFTKSILTAAAIAAVGLAGLGASAWNEPSPAQDQPPQKEAPDPAETARAAASRETVRHSKMIMLAAHNYHATNNFFPPPAITDKDGKPLLSWRVAILPFLDQEALYRQFHLDEPWDGPHNKLLIDKMPAAFESPESPAPKGQTRFRGFAGKGTIFDPNPPERGSAGRGVGIAEITDGTSNTVFLALARDPTVWTRPGELPYIAGQELPALDETNPQGALVSLCDGTAHRLPKERRDLLPLLLTRNGGEVLPQYWNEPAPNPTPPPVAPTPAGSSIEQRLQRLEEKIDRLLEKLGAGDR